MKTLFSPLHVARVGEAVVGAGEGELVVGDDEGDCVGASVGNSVGESDGDTDGDPVGPAVAGRPQLKKALGPWATLTPFLLSPPELVTQNESILLLSLSELIATLLQISCASATKGSFPA